MRCIQLELDFALRMVRVEVVTRMRGGETFRCYHELAESRAAETVRALEAQSGWRRRVRAWVEPLTGSGAQG